MKNSLTFVMVGHVDHGKSTLIGRMLYDTNSLREGVIEKVKEICQKKGKDFEHAFLLDALQEEQEQGITIDITKIEFDTHSRHYTIIDAPGHKEFLKNMISGAASAQAALLLVDAKEGVQEQTRRHLLLLSLLGITQIVVVINKMDLVDFSESVYTSLSEQVSSYLQKLNLKAQEYIPISAKLGDNVISKSSKMSWFSGSTILDALERFKSEKDVAQKPLRMPIQDVYKFDERRIVVGKVESGTLDAQNEVLLLPSGKTTTIKCFESWPDQNQLQQVPAGFNAGIQLNDEYFFPRGEIITHPTTKPHVGSLLASTIFWMSKSQLKVGSTCKLRLVTQEVECEVQTISKVIDSQTLESLKETSISRNDVAQVILKTSQPLVYDLFADNCVMGRFVLVQDDIVSGGGIITKALIPQRESITSQSHHITPKSSLVSLQEREARNAHQGKVLWLTGLVGSGKNVIANHLEKALFDSGKQVFHLDAGTLRYTLSSDLDFSRDARKEQVRRVAEVAAIMRQAGFIVIVSIVSPYKQDREQARLLIGKENFIEIFVDVPLEVCEKEDPNGVYSRARRGEITGLPGIDIEYEKSEYATVTLPINELDFNVEQKVTEIVSLLEQNDK